jgi:hypothetical protein
MKTMNTTMTNRLNVEVKDRMGEAELPVHSQYPNGLQGMMPLLVKRGWNHLFFIVFTFISLLIFLTTASEVRSEKFETPKNRNISDILPTEIVKGPHYRIRDKVVSYGYMHHFTVDSDFGVFEVTGDGALRKLLTEIKAIASLKEIQKSKAYLDSVKKAGKMPFKFGKNLIQEPVDTVSGIPKGVYRLFGNIATSLTETHDPSEDARVKQALAVSAYKRDYAYELRVDVYSSNSVLQKELNRVGWAGAIGGLSLTAVTFPAQGPVITAAKTMRFSNQLNEILKEEPPSRLRIINEKKLLAMGVSRDLAIKYLDHPAFTPRHDTIIAECLTMLENARGRDTFIKFVLSAEDEETANFFQNIAQTLRGYHETVSPVNNIMVVAGMVFAKANNGSALIPFPLDHGVWSKQPHRIFREVISSPSASGLKGDISLWVTGTVSSMARKQLGQLGIGVVENVDERIEFID